MLPIVHHPDYVTPLPSRHRFPMSKYDALFQRLCAENIAGSDNVIRPDPAPTWWLELAHDSSYVDAILSGSAAPEVMRRIGLPWSDALARRAQLAPAGTVMAAQLALSHGIACHTAGGSHHAGYDHGAGFCVFNDIAVAVRVLQASGMAMRFVIIDLDVHQGDGTARIFQGDPSVFTFSVHAARNFPARKATSDLDVALADGLTDAPYLEILEQYLPELLTQQKPDLVFYLAGVDAHEKDRLGALNLSDLGLAARDQYVLQSCRAHNLPVATVVGGGYDYNINALADRHAAVFRAAVTTWQELNKYSQINARN